MAKRRRRDDTKKIHKKDRQSSGEHRSKRTSDYDDDYESTRTPERRASPYAAKKRKDMMVIVGAIVCIVIIAGAYLFTTNYYDNIFSTNNSDDDNTKKIVPNPSNGNGNGNGNNGDDYPVPDFTLSYSGNPVAVIEVKNYGAIVIELYDDHNVRITVDNFMDYVRRGFYNGLIFHRVIDGFMIQGGGFNTDMTEKPLPTDKGPIPLEIDQTLKHVDGAVAMARTNDPNSATCQFFIDDGAQPHLEPGSGSDGYAVFGQVVAGMDIVRSISSVTTQTEGYYKDVPVNDVIINRVYEYFGPV